MRDPVRWCALLLFAALTGRADAHPVDEVVQGAYLTLALGELRLELDVTPGSEVAGRVLPALDPDGDRAVSEDEAQAFAQDVLDQSTLTLDGVMAEWELVDVTVPPLGELATGNAILKIMATAARPEAPGDRVLAYENRYEPAKSLWIANVFLQPGSDWVYRVTGQERSDDGKGLTVRYTSTPP